MKLHAAKILKANEIDSESVERFEAPAASLSAQHAEPMRILRGALVDAHEQAEARLERARQDAAELLERAQREAANLHLQVHTAARAQAAAEVAAQAVALAQAETQLDERGIERSIEYARLLAERLLGQALELEPELIVALARQILSEARAARRANIVAHPVDAQQLVAHAADLGLSENAVKITADSARPRGNLRIETEFGVLDAELAPGLERLADKLHQLLRAERLTSVQQGS